MIDITDAEVEAVARAMVVAGGRDPEELVLCSPSQTGGRCTRWQLVSGIARDNIAAHRAIEALKPAPGPVTVWTDDGEGWHSNEFPTLKAALLADHGTALIRITRNVDFEPVERS